MEEMKNQIPVSIAGQEGDSEIFRLAAALGTAIKSDPRMIRFERAKASYEKDETLQKLLSEYDVQQNAARQMAGDPDRDTHLIDMVQNRINELYEQIMAAPVYVELLEAQEAVNELMNAVNNTITFNITGEQPSGCTHDCSTCGGCH